MNKKSLDTCLKLEESLFELLGKKTMKEITIVEICENAHVTRSSFYRNFKSPYGLLKFSSKRAVEDLFSQSLEVYTLSIKDMMNWFTKKKYYLMIMFNNNMLMSFVEEIYQYILPKFNNDLYLNTTKDDPVVPYLASNVCMTIGGFLFSYCRNNMQDDEKIIETAIEKIKLLYRNFNY